MKSILNDGYSYRAIYKEQLEILRKDGYIIEDYEDDYEDEICMMCDMFAASVGCFCIDCFEKELDHDLDNPITPERMAEIKAEGYKHKKKYYEKTKKAR